MMKIISIVGARPQFIKAAVVSRAIDEYNRNISDEILGIKEIIIHTGQHYDSNMSAIFFKDLEIPEPNYNLGIGSGNHGAMTGAMLIRIEEVFLIEQPDCVIVYGDTNSTLAGALSAVKLHIPVAHVEAGLRSFNRQMPEEINRLITDHISSLLFCPTDKAVSNLKTEGITQRVFNVGDVMYDALLHYRNRAVRSEFSKPYAIASLHRAENTDNPKRLRNILSAICKSPIPILLPLHPRTKKAVKNRQITLNNRVKIIDPLPYFFMLGHLENCAFVVTDSGGLQKEAFLFGKRCITIRDETEWVELVDCGANRVVGADISKICSAFNWALEPVTKTKALFGDGKAGKYIINLLLENVK